jgi:hypothetical protein
MLHLIGIGHSHLHCVVDAWKQRSADQTSEIRLSTFQLIEKRYQPLQSVTDGKLVFNETIVSDATAVIATGEPRFFMFVGGAEHALWGLARDPRPFDCVTPSIATENESLCGEIFPYEMFVARAQLAAEYLTIPLAFLRTLTDQPIYQLCPPPPLRGTDLARIKIDPVLQEGVQRYGIAPDPFRVRIWEICLEGLRRACRTKDITFIEPPTGMIGADGCLASEAVSHDAVHANAIYGQLLLDSVIAL